MARELFAILVMCAAIAVLIWFINFVEKNLPDALGEAWGDVPHVPEEAKPIAKTLRAEGENRQQDRRRASNANEQEEPRTVPLGGAQ